MSADVVTRSSEPVLAACGVTQTYRLNRARLFEKRPVLTALDKVDFDVRPGEAVGLVGESGSGKSTLTRLLIGIEAPVSGVVTFEGEDVGRMTADRRHRFRRSVQMVLQDPRSSLDPRMRVGTALMEPLRSLRIEGDHRARVRTVLGQVGLDEQALEKYPHQFSGGQLQRIAIARALMPEPRVLVADEPVSALDVSIQAQVLNLLRDLVDELGLSLILIAHDLSVVAYTTSRVSVMASGRIVETGRPADLFSRPGAEATRNLVDAVLTVRDGIAGTALA
ncbi:MULTISPECIES: dipeptide/oligopeptide/nickel ABC transporter ATP-binding protein [unclassified Roseitalea]|uniref:ATP-binding cassette domain-containing protein n=1 Tax=unclassified Roseitalea TaxID=2639107 RepID=UPI00273EFD51|nr:MULTISPECIES: dipeptide/oligopeptide/nickel ABC transporter ATP-binding protein [unclassified Roseitalea]